MFKSPYETTPCRRHVMAPIVKQVVEANIHRQLNQLKEGTIFLVTDTNKNIPLFSHPLPAVSVGNANVTNIYLDARAYTRVDQRTQELTISGKDEFMLQYRRAQLMDVVYKQGYAGLSSVNAFPMLVFMRLITTLVSRSLALNDAAAELRLQVIAGAFWISLFRENKNMDDINRDTLIIRKVTSIPGTDILPILEQLTPMGNIEDFINNVVLHGGNAKFNNFSLPLLYTLIGGSWYGFQVREAMPVALEHPPTFISMVYAAIEQRSFHKTLLSQVVDAAGKSSMAGGFINAVDSLLEEAGNALN